MNEEPLTVEKIRKAVEQLKAAELKPVSWQLMHFFTPNEDGTVDEFEWIAE